jgi:hypothetical protein
VIFTEVAADVAPTSGTRRMSIWLAGRNTGTPPTSISSPPLILRVTLPLIRSPSAWCLTMRSQPRMRSARRLESSSSPVASSMPSMSTSIWVPGAGSSPSSNSKRGTTPSLL